MQCRGAKSLVDDLGLSRGVVISRAAFSLRSIETKPFDWGICPLRMDMSLFVFLFSCSKLTVKYENAFLQNFYKFFTKFKAYSEI